MLFDQMWSQSQEDANQNPEDDDSDQSLTDLPTTEVSSGMEEEIEDQYSD